MHTQINIPCNCVEHQLSRSCPYLDTIDRSVLDFDFEKLCSVSLLNNNVYACLVCGKYFQGMDFQLLATKVLNSTLFGIETASRADKITFFFERSKVNGPYSQLF